MINIAAKKIEQFGSKRTQNIDGKKAEQKVEIFFSKTQSVPKVRFLTKLHVLF
jgi:hypothetical protein